MLDTRKQIVADLVIQGTRQIEIHRKTGISIDTIRAWLREPEVQSYISEITSAIQVALISEYRGLVGDAITAIKEALNDPECPHSVRVGAAFRVIENVLGRGLTEPVAIKPQQTLSKEVMQEIWRLVYGLSIEEASAKADAILQAESENSP